MRVLLIEDEPRIADFITAGLGVRGFEVVHCADGRSGYDAARQPGFDAIVLDLMLPGKDGLAVLSDLRAAGHQVPVILLTALNELDDRLRGLALGADDYLAKPFYIEELSARLQAVARRLPGERQQVIAHGPLLLDRIERRASIGKASVELSQREFALLEFLMRSPGQVFPRAQILEHVWGYDFDPATNLVDVCVNRIRAKLAGLEWIPGEGERRNAGALIESVRGVGYRLRKCEG